MDLNLTINGLLDTLNVLEYSCGHMCIHACVQMCIHVCMHMCIHVCSHVYKLVKYGFVFVPPLLCAFLCMHWEEKMCPFGDVCTKGPIFL